MAASLQSLLLALDSTTGTTVRPNGTCQPNRGSLSAVDRALERHALRSRIQKRRRRIFLVEGFRKPQRRVKRRIRALRTLVPAGDSVGFDGLFTEAADYIGCLRMQLEVMQVLVKVLLGDSDE